MAAPDGTLHLVWSDNRLSTIGIRSGYFDVYYKRYLPGVGWGHDKQFSWDGTDHARPILTLGAGSTVNICWEDYRFGNPEIYYRQITPETGWDPDPSRLTSDAGASQSPTLLSVPGGGILLLWADARGAGITPSTPAPVPPPPEPVPGLFSPEVGEIPSIRSPQPGTLRGRTRPRYPFLDAERGCARRPRHRVRMARRLQFVGGG